MRLARLVFTEPTLSAVVQPAIADLQHELREAGTHRKRLAAMVRGMWALCRVLVVVAVAPPPPPEPAAAVGASRAQDVSWYCRHLGMGGADRAQLRSPEINFASIPVGSNAGGLIVVIGSTAILLAGIPELRPFFLMAVGGGLLAAPAILKWRSSHPFSAVPPNTIASRG
jgi:hypothetical protein